MMGGFFDYLRMMMGWWSAPFTPACISQSDAAVYTATVSDAMRYTATLSDAAVYTATISDVLACE